MVQRNYVLSEEPAKVTLTGTYCVVIGALVQTG
jgi:hypothetical protein